MTDTAAPSPVFIEQVQREVTELHETYPGLSTVGDAFTVWTLAFIHGLDEDDALAAAESRMQGAGDGGIDAVVSDDLAQLTFLLQAKYSPNLDATYDDQAASELYGGLDLLLSDTYAATQGPEFAALRDRVVNAIEGDSEIVLQLIVGGRMTDEAKVRATAYLESYPDLPIRLEIIEASDLYRIYVDRNSGDDLEGVEVTIRTHGPSLAIPAAASGLTSAQIAVLDGASLVETVERYGSRLVDLNVRYRLRRSRINDEIAKAATDTAKQRYFSLLNNGLTITCSSVTPGDGTVTLTNPQVVNGGQTTMVLHAVGESLRPGDLHVVARIIATSGPSGLTLAREITESTNRQNPIRPSDLKANDPIQKRIQSDFAALDPPWYYERRRNERASLSAQKKALFGDRVLTKEDVGQRWRAFRGKPAAAITAKQRLFEHQDLYGETYSRHIDVRAYLLAYQLFDFFHYLLDPKVGDLHKSFLPTMDADQRAELARARNQWAAHGTATAAYLLSKNHPPEPSTCEVLARELMNELRLGSGSHLELIRLVTVSGYKWFAARRSQALADERVFDVKGEFEKSQTFEEWCIEADANRVLIGSPLVNAMAQ